MKIKVIESVMSELDAELHSDTPDRESAEFAEWLNERPAEKPIMDRFDDYVNHSRSPARICIDGRLIRPGLVKSMAKSFKKIKGNENFKLKIVERYVEGEWEYYIDDPKYDI